MGKLAAFLAVSVGLVLIGCSSGPTDEELAASVEAQLSIAQAETAETIKRLKKTPTIETPSPTRTVLPSPIPTATREGFFGEIIAGGKHFKSCASFGCKAVRPVRPGEVHYFVAKNKTWCETDLEGVQAWAFCDWIKVRDDNQLAAATADAQTSYFVVRPTDESSPEMEDQIRFNKCVSLIDGIKYVIKGDYVTAVSLTFENDTSGTDQGNYKTPFCTRYTNFLQGDFLYISAQIIEGSGAMTCQIYDGYEVIAEANANGYASIATCSTTYP